MANKSWTREELILAFNLYWKLPFGKFNKSTPEVIQLANLMGRTPSSIAMRLSNFAHLDPYHQNRGVKGMAGGRKQVEPIWNEFFSNKEKLVFESEKILAEKQSLTIETKFEDILIDIEQLHGETKIRAVATRVNQCFFRQVVVSNYLGKCAITGIDIPDLLLASHIIPWSVSEEQRLNPENGICLSALYDRAFDKGYIGINPQFEILLSPALKKREKEEYFKKYFCPISGEKILLPRKYYPRKEFLEYHLDVVFKK